MKIVKVNQKATIFVYGVPFHGVDDIIKYALSGKPKQGVFVDKDFQHYPCFDFDDYATENRFYWNFVFAKSEHQLREKKVVMKQIESSINYCKLHDDTPDELLPMIYFGGDTSNPLLIGICEDVLF